MQTAMRESPLRGLSDTARALSEQYLRSARETLRAIVTRPDLLSGIKLERVPRSYTRNFLFGDGSIGVWAMVWAPESRTSIHDHHCSCCFAVMHGSIRERWFETVGEAHVRQTEEAVRRPGYVGCTLPSGPNIHQMVNDGPDEALSIHIYGLDHRRHVSSVHREYQLAPPTEAGTRASTAPSMLVG